MVTKHIETKISTLIRYHIPFAIFVQRATASKLLAWKGSKVSTLHTINLVHYYLRLPFFITAVFIHYHYLLSLLIPCKITPACPLSLFLISFTATCPHSLSLTSVLIHFRLPSFHITHAHSLSLPLVHYHLSSSFTSACLLSPLTHIYNRCPFSLIRVPIQYYPYLLSLALI